MRLTALLIGFFAMAWAGCAYAAIGAPVRLGNFALTLNPATTVQITVGTCNFGAACGSASSPAGALIACHVTWEVGSVADHVASATDSGGNTYTITTNVLANGGDANSTWIYKFNAAAVANGGTITATYSTTESYRSLACYSVTGIATTLANDFHGGSFNNTGGTAPSIATGTLANANEIIFAGCDVFIGGADTYTESASFTTLDTMAPIAALGVHTAQDTVSSTTGPTFAPTLGTSREFACSAQSFIAAAGGAALLTRALLGVGS